MTLIVTRVTEHLLRLLTSETAGLNGALTKLRKDTGHAPEHIRTFTGTNVPSDLIEKTNQAHYPAVFVYCEKLSNTLEEKFRLFGGSARVTAEIRTSGDRVEFVNRDSWLYADVVCGLLDDSRGQWSDSLWYSGRYDVTYAAIKAGGKQFAQSTKVTLEVDVSL